MSKQDDSNHWRTLFEISQTTNNNRDRRTPSRSRSPQVLDSLPSTSNSSPNSFLLSDSPSSLSPAQTESANRSPLFYGSDMSPSDPFLDSLVHGMMEGIAFDNVTLSGVQMSEIPSTSQQNNLNNAYSLSISPSPSMISNPSIFAPIRRPTSSLVKYCRKHPNNALMYCYTCPGVMCDICQMNMHQYHLTMELANAAEMAQNHSDRILEMIKGDISYLESNKRMLLKFFNDIDNTAYEAKLEIFSNLSEGFYDAQERKRELYWKIEEITASKLSLIKYQQQSLNQVIDQLRRIAEKVNDAKIYLNIDENPENLITVILRASQEMFTMKHYGLINIQIEDHFLSFSGLLSGLLDSVTPYGTIKTGSMVLGDEARALRGRGDYSLLAIEPHQHQYRQYHQQELQQQQRYYGQQQQQLQPYYGQQQQQPQVYYGRQQEQRIVLQRYPNQHPPMLQQNYCQFALQYYEGSLAPVRNFASRNPLIVVRIQNRLPKPLPVLIIGDENLPNNFCRPWGVACDKEGNIVVADRSNNRIKIYDKNGDFIRSFGTYGSGPGQFDRPAGIVVDKRNRVIVADKDNHRIQIVSKYGDYILAFGERGVKNGQFNYPWDVAVNSRCEIVVSDTRNHRIQLFTAEGEFLRKYGFETNQFMWKILDSPRSVCFTPNGDILVGDFNNHHILIIDYQFEEAKVFGPERRRHPFLRIQGMKVDDVGNVVVADSRNHRIQVLDPTGRLRFFFGREGSDPSQMDRPAGIAISPEGRIIIVDFGNNRVLVY